MKKSNYIVITGAAGFIGSCLVQHLSKIGFNNLILVDDFTKKKTNLFTKKYFKLIDREVFFKKNLPIYKNISNFIHLGAKTDTQKLDYNIFKHYNLEFSKKAWEFCSERKIPFIYASSAATYGSINNSFDDDHDLIPELKPLNPYAISKNEFDIWVLLQKDSPPEWIGLKFFNVYGPNECHKNQMASMVYHAFNQISSTGQVRLFRSYRRGFNDGDQKRDFIYVKDIIHILFWLTTKGIKINGIYNLGTGRARTFNELVNIIFRNLQQKTNIRYINITKELETRYQYFTEAKMDKFRKLGYKKGFTSLEDGINDYLNYHLKLASSTSS